MKHTVSSELSRWEVVLHSFTRCGSVGHNSESLRRMMTCSGPARGVVNSLSTSVWRSGRLCSTPKFGVTSSMPGRFTRLMEGFSRAEERLYYRELNPVKSVNNEYEYEHEQVARVPYTDHIKYVKQTLQRRTKGTPCHFWSRCDNLSRKAQQKGVYRDHAI